MKKNKITPEQYLDKYVFYGLHNLNDGFDVASIKYFNEEEFEIVLDRVEKLGIGINGIEPWKDGFFFGVEIMEQNGGDAFDPRWYRRVFKEFRDKDPNLQYAASYDVPERLLEV